jgi:hypothetical protein
MVQRGLFGAVALVVERGAIGRPLGLPADSLHTRHTRLSPRKVSSHERRPNHLQCRLPAGTYLCITPFG